MDVDAMDSVLLVLTLLASTLTVSIGRTNMLHGIVHLTIFGAFLFLTFQGLPLLQARRNLAET